MRALQDFLRQSRISRDQFYYWRKLGLIPKSVIKTSPLERGGIKIALTDKAGDYVHTIKSAREKFGQKSGLKRAKIFFKFEKGIGELRALVRLALELVRDERYGKFFDRHSVLIKSIASALEKGYQELESIMEKSHPVHGSVTRRFVNEYFSFDTPGLSLADILKLIDKRPYFIIDPNFKLSQVQRLYLDFKKKLPELKLFVRSLMFCMCQDELLHLSNLAEEDPTFAAQLMLNLTGFTKIVSQLKFREDAKDGKLFFFLHKVELGEYIQDKLLPLLQEKK